MHILCLYIPTQAKFPSAIETFLTLRKNDL
jgi:hypothetical protein